MVSIASRRHLDYVIFPWWPEDGFDWIMPEDVEIAVRLIPGKRVFVHRKLEDSPYQLYEYGTEFFRALPRLQQKVKGDGLLVGDRVEIRSRLGRRRPILGTICDMFWNDYSHCIDYRIRYRNLASEAKYHSEELNPLPRSLPEPEAEITIPLPSHSDADDYVYRILPPESSS